VLRVQHLGDVSQSTPQTRTFEFVETEVAVEGGRSVVDRVHDDGSGPELLAAPDAPAQSVDKKVTAQPVALLRVVQGQPGEHDDRDWVWHSPAKARRCGQVRCRTHGEGVVPDDPRSAAQDVGGCRPRSGGHRCSAREPLVQFYLAALEAFDAVTVC